MIPTWLDERLDQQPYFYNKDRLNPILEKIDEKKSKIERYFEVHPRARKLISTDERRYDRFRDSALSYLVLEGGVGLDIIPSKDKTDIQREIEQKEMKKVVAYQEACELVHNAAMDDSYYLDDMLLIRAHTQLYDNDPERRNFVRYRFRNEEDNEIVVGQGYFAPVPGALVAPRVNYLFFMYNNTWFKEHPIVKGAKFVTEYFRIQPHMDGNKRTSLMALNFILEKNGYPDIYIDSDQAPKFFEALKTGMLTRDVTDLALLFSENVNMRCNHRMNEILDFRLKGFEDRLKKEEPDEKG